MLLGLNCVCFSCTEGRGCDVVWTELFVSVSHKGEAVVLQGLNCLFQFHRRARLWCCLD